MVERECIGRHTLSSSQGHRNHRIKPLGEENLGLVGAEVLKEDLEGGRELLELGSDDHARASYDLAGVTLIVDLAETSPLAKLLGVGDLDEVDVVLQAEGLHELDVGGLSAVGSEGASGPASCRAPWRTHGDRER